MVIGLVFVGCGLWLLNGVFITMVMDEDGSVARLPKWKRWLVILTSPIAVAYGVLKATAMARGRR